MNKLQEIIDDAYDFISRLTIINKAGKKVRFQPTSEQLDILTCLLTGEDTLVLKPRQIGSSTIVAAYLFWIIYKATSPITVAILSYKLKSSRHLLKMLKTFYYNLPQAMQKPLEVINSTELRFADSGAGVIAESAGGDGGLRSFTCTKLWLSEFAFSPNPAELLATATSALNNGQLINESTANFFNDAHHQEIMKAERGQADWSFLFFPWHAHIEYQQDLPDSYEYMLTDEETVLQRAHGLTLEQLYWRRKKIEKIGWEKFSREFPLTVDEAYAQLGDSYFKKGDLSSVVMVKVEPVEQTVFEVPQPNDKYGIGVDVSAGVGRDSSVIKVLSKRTHQPVFIFRSNKTIPTELAKRIQEISTRYNDAKVLVESNNMGEVVLNELRHLGFTNFWKDPDGKDWQTNIKTKTAMFENMKKKIVSGALYQIDNITYAEIRSLTVNEKGHIVIPDNLEGHGDSAVALALACVCLDQVYISSAAFLPDFIKRKKAQRTTSKGGAAVSNHRRY